MEEIYLCFLKCEFVAFLHERHDLLKIDCGFEGYLGAFCDGLLASLEGGRFRIEAHKWSS